MSCGVPPPTPSSVPPPSPPPPSPPPHDQILAFASLRGTSVLSSYLSRFSHSGPAPREHCCGTSRSLFCPACLRLLPTAPSPPPGPSVLRPPPPPPAPVRLPFVLDLLCMDHVGGRARRAAHPGGLAALRSPNATGPHLAVLCAGVRTQDLPGSSAQGGSAPPPVPPRDDDDVPTYFLYPSSDSVPLASVAGRSGRPLRLVIPDARWTGGSAASAAAAGVPRVHLSHPPGTSGYWRWHDEGDGRVCTVEAVFYAALEVCAARGELDWGEGEEADGRGRFLCSETDASEWNLVQMMYLFGMQRAMVGAGAKTFGGAAAYTEAGKEKRRLQRKKK